MEWHRGILITVRITVRASCACRVISYLYSLWHTFTLPNFAGLLMVLYPLLPETPYWLVLNGDLAAAESVLQRMARINGVPLPEVLP